MKITLQNVGRRYDRTWVFRHVDYAFASGKSYAVLGPNGSGKSTFLKILTGSLSPSEGKVFYSLAGRDIDGSLVHRHMVIAAPYIELIEEFSVHELIDFHFKFKNYRRGIDKGRLLQLLALQNTGSKEIKYFSSGMKQRLKLTLACCTESDVVFLDEPMSNLDEQGERWCLSLLEETRVRDSLLIIGSNQEKEYSFCDERINMLSYK